MQLPAQEPSEALAARSIAANEIEKEAYFWNNSNLYYIGDLKWTNWEGSGFEYISDIKKEVDNGFSYVYGLVGLDNEGNLSQTLVCRVRNKQNTELEFEMEVGGKWMEGPLQMWLDTLQPEVQQIARERYREVIQWVRIKVND